MRPVRRGFTLFEVLVALFVFIMGILGVVSTFSAGMNLRMRAEELLITQELANSWNEWVRFRLNATGLVSGDKLAITNLTANPQGDFFNDGSNGLEPSTAALKLPTLGRNAYKGYTWEVTHTSTAYKPQWRREDNGALVTWDKRKDGANLVSNAMGSAPGDLTEVELTITRGARKYTFVYVYSGVGLKYD